MFVPQSATAANVCLASRQCKSHVAVAGISSIRFVTKETKSRRNAFEYVRHLSAVRDMSVARDAALVRERLSNGKLRSANSNRLVSMLEGSTRMSNLSISVLGHVIDGCRAKTTMIPSFAIEDRVEVAKRRYSKISHAVAAELFSRLLFLVVPSHRHVIFRAVDRSLVGIPRSLTTAMLRTKRAQSVRF